MTSKTPSKQKPLVLSLFCGAGGLDLGFERLGFEVGLAIDIRTESVQSYNLNRKLKCGHARDIRELNLADLDNLFGGTFKPLGIIGGPPCQGFSVSNVNQCDSDKRNDLSFSYARLLGQLNNRSPVHFFVIENVTGLLGRKHNDTFLKIKSSFSQIGFEVNTTVLNAADYGTPQNRHRLVIVGYNSTLYPKKTWNPPAVQNRASKSPATVRQAIGDLPEPIFFSKARHLSGIPYHPNHWCMTPKSSKFSDNGPLKEGSSFGRSFRTLNWDHPSPTVAYGHREVHVHPSGRRRLSVHEAMLLQGFPKQYKLEGNLSQQITQVSEAVPPPLSKAIAASIYKQLGLDYAGG